MVFRVGLGHLQSMCSQPTIFFVLKGHIPATTTPIAEILHLRHHSNNYLEASKEEVGVSSTLFFLGCVA